MRFVNLQEFGAAGGRLFGARRLQRPLPTRRHGCLNHCEDKEATLELRRGEPQGGGEAPFCVREML